MAHIDMGPAILYYSKHSAIGAPYHRQHQGIIASCEVMEKSYDEKLIKKILKKTGASYILAGKSDASKGLDNSLSNMILSGNFPKWLTPVQLPEKFKNVVLAKIDKEQIN